jgi:hypothetical protein
MNYDLKEIFQQFTADGTYLIGEPYGSGHIHDTFNGSIIRFSRTYPHYRKILKE